MTRRELFVIKSLSRETLESEILRLERKLAEKKAELRKEPVSLHPMHQALVFDLTHGNALAFRTKTGLPHDVFVEMANLLTKRFGELKMYHVLDLRAEDLFLVLNKIRSANCWQDLQVS